MTTKKKYTLESYIRTAIKHVCPNPECGQKEFTRYVYTDSGEYISEEVGICNRKIKCNYHYRPSEYFRDHPESKPRKIKSADKSESTKVAAPPVYIPESVFQKSVKRVIEGNNLIKYLNRHFPMETLYRSWRKYFFGTDKKGAIIYWQVDILKNIRAGKIINYDPETGKRIQNVAVPVEWVHKKIDIPGYVISQCFFGERLLAKHPEKPIAIVESEKTALICDLLYPDWIWLATGGMDGLSEGKCLVLKGKTAYLFPDVDAHQIWKKRAYELRHVANFIVSDFLYNNIPEAERAKQDIADFLLNKYSAEIKISSSDEMILSDHRRNVESIDPSALTDKSPFVAEPILSDLNTAPVSASSQNGSNHLSVNESTINPQNSTLSNKFEYQILLSSWLRDIKFSIGFEQSILTNLNFYLLYRLIAIQSETELKQLFHDKPYFSRNEFMDKLPDVSAFRSLRTDGTSSIKNREFSLYMYYQTGQPRQNIYSGLLYFSIPLNNFKSEHLIDETIRKVKSLQNVVLVYSEKTNYLKALKDGTGRDFRGGIDFIVYFGKLSNSPEADVTSVECNTMAGYPERWCVYDKYLRSNIDVSLFNEQVRYGLTVYSDPDVWFNPMTNSLVKWEHFVLKYRLQTDDSNTI